MERLFVSRQREIYYTYCQIDLKNICKVWRLAPHRLFLRTFLEVLEMWDEMTHYNVCMRV